MNMQFLSRLMMLALSAFALPALADEPRFTPAREVAVKVVVLPTSDPGLLTLTCSGCPTRSFLTTLTTSYRIGEARVSLKEMREHLARISGNATVVLHIADDRQHVISIAAPPAQGS